MFMRSRKAPVRKPRIRNSLLFGGGAGTTSDLGAIQKPSSYSLSPYYNNNFLSRYQTWVSLYETSWEARKIVDIPVDDCMRQETIREGLSPDDELIISRAWIDYKIDSKLRRALKQERLLGGSVILGVMTLQTGEDLSQPLDEKNLLVGDLKALNVIDVTKLSRSDVQFDPFSQYYDAISSLLIQGEAVDVSRMVVFEGDALFSRNSQRIVQNFRYNPLGFGESKLAPLYDVLVRSIGTQQGAFHLVNRASSLLITVNNLRSIIAADSNAEYKLNEISSQLSLFNSAIIDGKDVHVDYVSPSFGSIPELILTFTQLLASASDIPVTRFMGSSASGLNATGEGDSRNYYDMVDTLRTSKRLPAERKLLNWVGSSIFGYSEWEKKSKNLNISYPPLWNLDAVEQATRDEIIIRTIASLYTAGLITEDSAVKELLSRDIFETKIEAERGLEEVNDLSPTDFASLLTPKDDYAVEDTESAKK